MLLLLRPTSKPDRQRYPLARAFRAPHLLAIHHPETCLEVVQALAERLSPEEVEVPLDALRLRWWRGYDPAKVKEQALAARWHRGEAALQLTGWCLWGPEQDYTWQRRYFYLPDDVFFYGPPAPGVPLEQRRALKAALLGAVAPEAGIALEQGFPLLDYARVEEGSWSWNETDDGSEGARLIGGALSVGYQYRYDVGWSTWAAERFLTGAPELYSSMPGAVRAEILARLEAARLT